jgi:DNA-binding CsgD family transcriptional regulator
METLSIEDLHKLNQRIQQIYSLKDLDTFGIEALKIVDRLVPGELPMFHLTYCRLPKMEHQIVGFSLTPELNRVIHQNFDCHPILHNMPQTLTGAYKISDFITQQELYRFEGLYQQFLKVLGVEEQIVFFLPNANPASWSELKRSDTCLISFALHRTQRNFTERDRSILNLLRSHLAQAYTNAKRYHELQQELSQVQQSLNHLGVVTLDDEWRIKSIAPQAIIWLETYFGKSTCSAQLPDSLRSWVKYQITNLEQKTDLQRNCLPLRMQQGGRELTIRSILEPNTAQYLLLLEEKTLSSFSSLTLLGLSQRETEVLTLVLQGKDNKAIGTQLSIHPSTVRKHLEHIYSKWGVTSRTEAIAHALAKLGLF